MSATIGVGILADKGLPPPFRNVKALYFDVFGTVVDWRSTVHAELIRRAREKVATIEVDGSPPGPLERLRGLTEDDWAEFAQTWRDAYSKFTKTFVPGVTEWKDIDTHHYDSLIKLLDEWSILGAFTEDEIKQLSLIWHYLTPWKDSSQGLHLLGTAFVTSTLSNGNRSLLSDLNNHGELGFQHLTSAADFQAYKPDKAVYLGGAKALGFQPEECALVAAHLGDLEAARSCGFKTVYVERPREEALAGHAELIEAARDWVDLWVPEDQDGFLELARQLGISER